MPELQAGPSKCGVKVYVVDYTSSNPNPNTLEQRLKNTITVDASPGSLKRHYRSLALMWEDPVAACNVTLNEE
jgi:hypothetical protein